jgi:hypothetical protein
MALFTTDYNFVRIHKKLRVTPAMAAGFTRHFGLHLRWPLAFPTSSWIGRILWKRWTPMRRPDARPLQKERARMTKTAFKMLNGLLCSFCDGNIDAQTFCRAFEQAFNFEVDRASLSREEEAIFKEIFDEVVFFCPFPDEIRLYPRYRNEAQISAVVNTARQKLTPRRISN